MNDDTHAGHAERVTLMLGAGQRTRLDLEAVQRSIEAGRPVSRSSIVREILDRALAPGGGGQGEAA